MIEEFRDIQGYEGLYQISNLGRIKSLKFKKEKILKCIEEKDKYLIINLYNKKQKMHKVHRLVLLSFKPEEYFEGAVCNHKNSIRCDNRLDNLEWCTPKENIHHGIKNGFINVVGENNKSSKLKEHQIQVIRNLYKVLKNQTVIARLFNVRKNTISRIINNKTWTHVIQKEFN